MTPERQLSRRGVLLGAAAALTASGCGRHPRPAAEPAVALPSGTAAPLTPTPTPTPTPAVRLIGDGSTADTGPQPHQPVPERLAPGAVPPQFVVLSWDGAAELDQKLFSRFRAVAGDLGASMTFFLSGVYLLPVQERLRYQGPRHRPGASDINLLTAQHVRTTLEQVRLAWLDGHEIGTHFNGHFCGADGVGDWTPAEWADEIRQAMGFVQSWRTNTGFTDLPPLPFDYAKELTGSRTPCLQGQQALLPTAAALGWTYDASSPGGRQVWPAKTQGLWDFPLQAIPFPGHSFEVLSMDYNIMANQSRKPRLASPQFGAWREQARGAYLAGFQRAYTTNRAPYFVGNHFEQWNGGIYMDAVEDAARTMAALSDVRFVSFRQLVAWLDAQDPAVLARWRTLQPGQAPDGGWAA